MDYAKPLLESITRPLIKDGASGVPDALKTLKEYQLLREDIENLQEFNNWPGSKDPMSAVDGKVSFKNFIRNKLIKALFIVVICQIIL